MNGQIPGGSIPQVVSSDRRSSLPANNPTKIIEQLQRQLDTPFVRDFLKANSGDTLDIVFRISRRQVVSGPKLTVSKLPPS